MLEPIHLSLLNVLTVANCPRLELPVSLQAMHQLITLIIYNNCTVARWDDDAALTTCSHPSIRNLYLIRSSWTRVNSTLPRGLMTGSVPTTLSELCVVDSDEFVPPSDFAVQWKQPLCRLVCKPLLWSTVPLQLHSARSGA
ncbi:TPA: hypothetical protein N0F65_005291 [Lagenidium giganteum]|uniref:Uncharacterized protein n=1 Tax=Lagenidium giganteum TaxID=4803 RepID=A0AAV2Z3R3_9STRA|nr:TPA: hypothetical protein N0F65_005291 [Lagenidium giganteum]